VPWGRFTQALCIRGRLHGRARLPAAKVRALILGDDVVRAVLRGVDVVAADL
jgi:hypothetical protein